MNNLHEYHISGIILGVFLIVNFAIFVGMIDGCDDHHYRMEQLKKGCTEETHD